MQFVGVYRMRFTMIRIR